MASTQPNNFYLPHFPPPPSHPLNPPPPPSHFNPPAPPPHSFNPPAPPFHLPPPPPPHGHPPPPPSHPLAPPPPHARQPPPSPHHPIVPPPPHAPTPPSPVPLPPPPSPNHPIVIVVVIVSLGGFLCLSMLAFALFCFVQKRKRKTQETDIIHIDEHKKITETIVPGPFGRQTVVVSVEDDVHIDKETKKKNEKTRHGLDVVSSSEVDQGNPSSLEVGTTSHVREVIHYDHHKPENKS